ncbi:hypothetical protein NQ317_010341 [Molorchus minor]|uniref:Golgi apparatus protein 1 n=1 Tax=Molorchus minor TaxID=1323400 RepID=A0ABQ9JU22_9CUCU|nr:hypothetical protein NQ317_010341 [Molorchus minor]
MACKSHAMKLCYNAKSKSEVVACLSANLLNSTIHGVRSSIPKDCKQQLRSQIFQQRENINLNPALQSSCSTEIKKFCNINKGSSQVQECLQTVPHDALSTKCEKQIFKMKQMEIYDNSVDYALLTTCAATINLFCPNHDKETVLDCLKLKKNTNSLLNPSLQEDCDLDINKLCKNDAAGDAVIKCLKTQFKLSRLSNKCEKTMADMLRDQALNVDLNPLLKVVCKNEIGTICKFSEEDAGKVEECLKTAFMKKNIPTPECQYEVANMIEESQVDIEADPLLQSACALDLLTYCNNVTQGNGRRIQCLKSRQTLTPNCKHKLKERFEMYRNAIQVAPLADFQDLYQHVVSSPSKSYFVIFFCNGS